MAAPLVTIAMPSFRHERYVGEAVQSLFAQTYTPLQIVVCDDASTDRTYEIVADLAKTYNGPHQLDVARNETRLGMANYNRLMEMSRGELIVLAHSDDVSLPERTTRLVDAWQRHGVSMVTSNATVIDGKRTVRGPYVKPGQAYDVTLNGITGNGWNPAIFGPTLAWERAVFDEFGPLTGEYSAACIDWILPFRAALLRGIHYVPQALLLYRTHEQSLSEALLFDRQDRAAHDENHLANATINFLHMLETLRAYRPKRPQDDARLAEIDQRLVDTILRHSVAWARLRARMMIAGRRIKWVSPA